MQFYKTDEVNISSEEYVMCLIELGLLSGRQTQLMVDTHKWCMFYRTLRIGHTSPTKGSNILTETDEKKVT